jgi:hypothetical protein
MEILNKGYYAIKEIAESLQGCEPSFVFGQSTFDHYRLDGVKIIISPMKRQRAAKVYLQLKDVVNDCYDSSILDDLTTNMSVIPKDHLKGYLLDMKRKLTDLHKIVLERIDFESYENSVIDYSETKEAVKTGMYTSNGHRSNQNGETLKHADPISLHLSICDDIRIFYNMNLDLIISLLNKDHLFPSEPGTVSKPKALKKSTLIDVPGDLMEHPFTSLFESKYKPYVHHFITAMKEMSPAQINENDEWIGLATDARLFFDQLIKESVISSRKKNAASASLIFESLFNVSIDSFVRRPNPTIQKEEKFNEAIKGAIKDIQLITSK